MTATLNALYAGCLADPDCKAGWRVLTDAIAEAVEADPYLTVRGGGRWLRITPFVGNAVLLVTVDGAGAALRLKDLPKWLPRLSKPR